MSPLNNISKGCSNPPSPELYPSATSNTGSQAFGETPTVNSHSSHALNPEITVMEQQRWNSSGDTSPFYSPFQRVPSSGTVLTEVTCRNLSFFICDSPDNERVAEYIKLFKEKGITDVVRACKPKYDEKQFEREGIKVHEFYFEDGGIPPESLLTCWLSLVYECMAHNSTCLNKTPPEPEVNNVPTKRSIAVHCVAGLGRAPLLVAIALVEFGMPPEDAIEYIRTKRKGSLNSKQIRFLADTYRPHRLYSSGGVKGSQTLSVCTNNSQRSCSSNSSQESLSKDSKGFFKNILRIFS